MHRLTATVAVASLVTACGGTQDADVARTATGLLDAFGSGDGAGACALLAPPVRTELEDTSGSPCGEAVLEEDLGARSGSTEVEVFDTMARAVVGSETLFLSRFDGRWLVVAAACDPVAGEPYDCAVGMP